MKKYIWYGKDKFDINKLKKFELNDNILVSQYWDKPKEYYYCYSDDTARLCYPFDALWASPIDTDLSWDCDSIVIWNPEIISLYHED